MTGWRSTFYRSAMGRVSGASSAKEAVELPTEQKQKVEDLLNALKSGDITISYAKQKLLEMISEQEPKADVGGCRY
jgi:Asp-tRNA(Asn)/Glu-tRNA(Gln) amidotransferase B subunit